MAEAAVVEGGGERPPYRLKPNWPRRLLRELLALLLGLAFLLAIGLAILDTAPGHRWVVDRIAGIETSSGLRFRIGRIDGSLFGETKLKNVAILDQHGTFLTSPEIDLDWTPGAWLYNKLYIERLHADRATLLRLPKLKPSTKKKPILPGFDIHIGKLSIDRLEIGKAVAGTPRIGRLEGSADVRSGRALVKLNAAIDGSDRLLLNLDAEPDGNRFDLELRAHSIAGGVIPALLGSKRSLDAVITGDGSWSRWNGRGGLNLSGRPTARLRLTATDGRFSLSGAMNPSQFLRGRQMRMTAPVVRVTGSASLRDRILDGQITLGSGALRAVASGALDLANNRFRTVRIGLDLLKPNALFTNMTGRNVRMLITLDGPFGTASYAYRLTSPGVKFDQTGFVDVLADGRGQLSPWPMRVPLHLQAKAITGVGDTASAILANARLDGVRRRTRRWQRAALALADARSAASAGKSDHGGWRHRKCDPCKRPARRDADDHAKARSRRQYPASKRAVERQGFAPDRSR